MGAIAIEPDKQTVKSGHYFEYFEASMQPLKIGFRFTIQCVCKKSFVYKFACEKGEELCDCPHCNEMWCIGYHPRFDNYIGVTRPKTNRQIWLRFAP